jgi:hypothetical protein
MSMTSARRRFIRHEGSLIDEPLQEKIMSRKPTPQLTSLAVRSLTACLVASLSDHGASARTHSIATSRTVTNCLDSGPGSLRDTVASAHDSDNIDLTQLTCGRITLTSGSITTSLNIGILGPGSTLLTIDGNNADRVFTWTGDPLSGMYIERVTLTNGYGSEKGGCVYSAGAVALDDVVITGCRVVGVGGSGLYQGGGIYTKNGFSALASRIVDNEVYTSLGTASGGGLAVAGGVASIVGSTISGNRVESTAAEQVMFSGGADIGQTLYLDDSTVADNSVVGLTASAGRAGGLSVAGQAVIQGCTISGNMAGAVGGLAVGGAGEIHPSLISDSTISGNVATTIGGAILSNAITIANSTIAFNSETYTLGAGLYIVYGVADIESSIIASNSGVSSTTNIGVYAGSLTGANNIIGSSGATLLPPDTIQADPRLLPLADNGGLTMTHALRLDSPAVNAGNNAQLIFYDQRGLGFPRTLGSATDIGAFESDVGDLIFSSGFDPDAKK